MGLDTQSLGKDLNELLVLASLREGPRHGYQIALQVEEESGGAFTLRHGTLYPILHRLERGGLIRGRWRREGGRRRKEYGLTRSGRRHLAEEAGRVKSTFEQLVQLLGGESGGSVRPRPAQG